MNCMKISKKEELKHSEPELNKKISTKENFSPNINSNEKFCNKESRRKK